MNEPDDRDQLWSEATLWFARMRSPDAEGFRAEFEEWLARGALHRRYYNRASEHWLHGTAAYAEERARVHAAKAGKSGPSDQRPTKRKPRTIAAFVAASVFIAGSTFILVTRDHRDVEPAAGPAIPTSAPSDFTRFATAAGERRAVHLGDGSLVLLAGDTLLRVQFEPALRRLALDRGGARFDVAHEARPFVVFAGGGSVTAHGTVFDVSVSREHRVSVRLLRGSVDVQLPPSGAADRPARRLLKPGDALTFQTSARPTSAQASLAPAPNPPDSAHDYRNVQLAEIVAEANRHAVVPIRFADPAIGGRMVSGRFRTDDSALLAERLAALLDLAVDRRDASRIVLRPK